MIGVELLYQLVIFSISIVLLSKSSQVMIDNSVKIAKMTKLGELVIGFLLLSVASSIPEMAVSFSAITSGDMGISIGNLLGSNVTDLGLALGITAIMAPIIVHKKSFNKLLTILFLSSIIPLLLLALAQLSRIVGIFLIGTFVAFSFYSVKERITLGLTNAKPKGVMKKILQPFKFYKSVFMFLLGLFLLMLSSRFVVSSSSAIAGILNIAESVIGATVISLGTCVPEISIAFSGIKKGYHSLILGNTIGSCLTKITLILGAVLLVSPLSIDISVFSTLLIFTIASTLITWYFIVSGRKLDRREGVTLVFIYIIFLIFTFGFQITLTELF